MSCLVNHPMVTVAIPTYNRAGLVEETVLSIKKQTLKDLECIIVDDNSTDDSVVRLESVIDGDPRFHLIVKDRALAKGAQTSRNLGIKKATGKYLVLLDSDDLLAPDCLRNRLEFMEKRPGVDFGVFPGLRFRQRMFDTPTIISTFRGNDPIAEFLGFHIPWNFLNVIWRTEALRTNNVFCDEELKGYQDVDFNLRALLQNLRFDYADSEPDCFWRVQDSGNIGSNLAKGSFVFSHVHFIAKLEQEIESFGVNCKYYKKKLSQLAMKILERQLQAEQFTSAEMFLRELAERHLLSAPLVTMSRFYIYVFKWFHTNNKSFLNQLLFWLYKFFLLKQPPFYRENKHFLIHDYEPSRA